MTTILSRSLITCAHRARLINAVTGESIPLSAVALLAAPRTWSVRLRGNDAIVIASEGTESAPASVPVVLLTVAPAARHRLIPQADGDPWTVHLELSAEVLEARLQPAPTDLTVHLLLPRSDTPSAGRTVALRAAHDDAPHSLIPLPEREPGIYSAQNINWTAPFVTADLLVDGSPLRRIAVDVHSQRTHIQLVDTI